MTLFTNMSLDVITGTNMNVEIIEDAAGIKILSPTLISIIACSNG